MVSFAMNAHFTVIMINKRPGLKCLTILVILIPLASALSFNLTTFPPTHTNITYEGAAHADNNTIHLTGLDEPQRAARATYSQPLHLWDRASGNVTDFATHFSFVVDSSNSTEYGDGFTFFLQPTTSRLSENAVGGSLGLTGLFWNSTEIRLVAVEFDIYQNDFKVDPPYEHVAIDINGVYASATKRWLNHDGIMQGRRQEAWISYDSGSRNLSVVFTGFRNGSSITQSLNHTVDFATLLQEYVTVGFSAATGGGTVAQNINSWSFTSNLQGKMNKTVPTTPNGNNTDHRRPNGNETNSTHGARRNTTMVIGSAVAGPVLILVLLLLVFILWRQRKRTLSEADKIGDEFENGTVCKKFAYNDLKAATSNFAEENKLGAGGFGSVYKGFIKSSKSYVAVKKIASDSKQGVQEFGSEVKTISTLRHRNLVQLLGWCYERKELLLVYEFMPNGSLDFHLFKGKSMLDWVTRFKIVKGLASALLYLHEEWEQYIVHRDIKSSNIMLDANFNARLGDFGLAKLVDHDIKSQTTFPVGTWGYMAPEYMINWRASKETDVFSFGIVALEIATGQKSRLIRPDGNVEDLAEQVWGLYRRGKLLDAADPQLNSDFNSQEMEQLLGVGLWCAYPQRNVRPSIRDAIRVLKFEATVPILPVPEDLFSSSYESSDNSKSK